MVREEQQLTLSDASKIVPGCPHASTLWRWSRQGLHGIRLEYLKIGRRIVTSREALDRFFQRVTEADQAAYAKTHPIASRQSSPSNAQHNKALAAAEKELAEAGI